MEDDGEAEMARSFADGRGLREAGVGEWAGMSLGDHPPAETLDRTADS